MNSLGNSGFFFFGKREIGLFSQDNGLGINARAFASVERGDDYPGVFPVEERHAETLVAPDFLERIEAHNSCFMDAFHPELAQPVGNFEEFLDFPIQLLGFLQLVKKNFFQILGLFAGKKDMQFLFQAPILYPQKNDDEEQNDLTAKEGSQASVNEKRRKAFGRTKHTTGY